MQDTPLNALSYFLDGFRLILKPGFRRFMIIPILVNLVIFIGLTIVLLRSFDNFFLQLLSWMPNWLEWLSWLLWPLAIAIYLIIYGYSFNLITTVLGAPFFGLLAEKIENELTGRTPENEPLASLIPRTFIRELQKLWYFSTRGFLILLVFIVLFFIPGFNLLGVALATIWSCWCMAVQYLDYPADNHQLSFHELRKRLNQLGLTSYGFGGLVMVSSMIPLLNIIVAPAAVAGATIFWVKEVRKLNS